MAYSENATFYNANREPLASLATELALPPEATQNLAAWVDTTQPWARGDHARPAQRVEVDDQKSARMHALYGQMGLIAEQRLPSDHYAQIVVLGSTQLGNNRRVGLTRRMFDDKVSTDHVIMLGGERAPFPESEQPLIDKNIAQLTKQDKADPWLEEIVKGEVGINWETDMLRLSAAIHFGRLTLAAMKSGNTGHYPELTHLVWEERSVLMSLLHAKAVARAHGAPRHTTESSIPHWLRVLPPQKNAKVGFVTANPHIERTTRVARNALLKAGRGDIELVASGSGAAESYRHEIFLGEVARNLYEDQQAVAQPSTRAVPRASAGRVA